MGDRLAMVLRVTASLRIWALITTVGAAVPTALGGCSVAYDVYMDQVLAAYGQDRRQQRPLPAYPPLEDRAVAVTGPFAMALGPAVGQVSAFSPADRQYLLDRSVVLLRRRFPMLVAVSSTQTAVDQRFSTILELDAMSYPDKDGALNVRIVLRVRDRNGTVASVIQGQLFDIDAKRTNQRKLIDEALPLIDAKADMLLR